MKFYADRKTIAFSISLTWLAVHCAFFADRRVIFRLRVDRCPPGCSEQFPELFPTDRTAALRYSELPPTMPSRLLRAWKTFKRFEKNLSFLINSFQIKLQNRYSLVKRRRQQDQNLLS